MTITINLKGRLGNQLFQYAVLRNLSIKKGFNFYINTQLEWHGQSNLLNQFNIKESDILNEIYYIYSQPVNSNYYDININNINDNTILDGHFENVEYFSENLELIKNELSIKNNDIITLSENFINEIRKDDSKIVGIHFRRGDVIQEMENIDEFNNSCKKFVYESLEKIKNKENKKITLLIFTGGIREKGSGYGWIDYAHEDDLKWVHTFLIENQSIFNIHISPGTIENNVLIDYYLISQCDYFISPRQSTFSFMACYLSKKKIKIFSPTNLYGGIDTS